jgi:CBS-domain-containing membrane protein
VGATGFLVGTLSASDVKLLGSDLRRWDLLGVSCKEFLQVLTDLRKETNIRNQVISDIFEEPQDFVVSVRATDSLATAIRRIVFYSLHRIFVTSDDDATLVGAVSIIDILREALRVE